MSTSRENGAATGVADDLWVLALVGVPAAALLSPGEWTIIDSAVGALIITVLHCVNSLRHGIRFLLAYSGIYGMALLLIVGLPADILIYKLQLHDKLIFSLDQGPSLACNELIQIVIWLVASSIVYLVNLRAFERA